MEKTKKNLLLRSAGVLMGVSILSTCVLGGTLAKYFTSKSVTANANVAKWSIEVGEEKQLKDLTADDLKMFDHVYDLDGGSPSIYAAGDSDSEVDGNKLAPGTWGSASFKIKNASDVKANISASLTKNVANNLPLLYSNDGSNWTNDLSSITLNVDLEPNAEDSVAFLWKWAFDKEDDEESVESPKSNDTTDTAIGVAAVTSPETAMVDVNITATQLD